MIFTLLTVVIPLYMTYQAFHSQSGEDSKLWSTYWGLFTVIKSVQWFIPFLSCDLCEFFVVMISLWLYHEEYKGALFLNKLFCQFVESNEALSGNINMMSEKLAFLQLFEKSPVVEKVKKE